MKLNKKPLLTVAAALLGLGGVALATSSAASYEGVKAAGDQIGTTIGFENTEGFTNSTTYNNDDADEFGPEGTKWGIVHGSVASTGAIAGDQSLQMRYYTSGDHSGHLPYAYMNYGVDGVYSVSFKAANTGGNDVTVRESLDGTEWTNPTTFELGTSASTYTYYVSSANAGANGLRFRFDFVANATSGTTRVYVDDVAFFAEDVTPSLSVAASGDTWVSDDVDQTLDLTASVRNFGENVTYTWTATAGSDLVQIEGEGASVTVSAVAGASGSATISVNANDGTNDLTETIDIDVLEVITVDEACALAPTTSGAEYGNVLVGGYVQATGRNSVLVDATASSAANGTDSIMLYGNNYPDFSVGHYAIVFGLLKNYKGTIELDTGYSVISTVADVAHLVAFINGSDTADQCDIKYPVAKGHYNLMSDADKTSFRTGEDYAAARARYEAWASATGDVDPYGTAASAMPFGGNNNTVMYTLIGVSAFVLVVTGLAVAYIVLRRKKRA